MSRNDIRIGPVPYRDRTGWYQNRMGLKVGPKTKLYVSVRFQDGKIGFSLNIPVQFRDF